MPDFKVRFQPQGRTVRLPAGQNLLAAARKLGLHLNAPCGGMGVCGNCRVLLIEGQSRPTPAELQHLRPEEIDKGMRLACQITVAGDLTVFVPQETRLQDQKILSSGTGKSVPLDPAVRKEYVELCPATIDDQRSDLDRLLAALPVMRDASHVPLPLLRSLPGTLRRSDHKVTAVTSRERLLAVEEGRTTQSLFGAAFDLGTTTVVGMLVDLNSGQELAVASRTNPQIAYGDDVVSRIRFTDENPDGLTILQSQVVNCLNEIILDLCDQLDIAPHNIYELTAVGNTTMMHLLLGVPPASIAQAPYVGAFRTGARLHAHELGLTINPHGRLYVLPGIAGFVGADTVGVILAGNMNHDHKVRLAVDIGTNGEIVLGSGERLLCCSTAAGPAFEGARIKFGMRAATGAIETVDLDSDVRLRLIAGERVIGICGTGLIDAVAELLRVGIIDPTGRILRADQVSGLPEPLARRIHTLDGASDFVLAHADATLHGEPIYLTQRDVREVQLAKAAIAAGISILKSELGVTDEKIDEVLLAGAFGNYIRKDRAVAIGLLPAPLLDRVRFVGNAAGVGARLTLVNQGCRDEAEEISLNTRYVELAGRADFQTTFTDALLFPEQTGERG